MPTGAIFACLVCGQTGVNDSQNNRYLGTTSRHGNLAAYGFGVGLAAAQTDDHPLAHKLEVLDIQGHQLRPAQGCREPEEQQCTIPDAFGAVHERQDSRQVLFK
jgi:hypothetical protein